MHFVKTEQLKKDMRVGRPIYNRKGNLMYDRNASLSDEVINAIKQAGLIGIYVLEPSEPLPPISEEDAEFERFISVNVFTVQDEMDEIIKTHRPHRIERLTDEIIKEFSRLRHKINFFQNVRSREDFIFKHSLNVAILSALMAGKMNATDSDLRDCVRAGLVHDVGKTYVPDFLLEDEEDDEVERILNNSQDTGFELIDELFPDARIRDICVQEHRVLSALKYDRERDKERVFLGARILLVADTFDSLTAVNATGGKAPWSYVRALRFLLDHPEVYNKKAVETLVESINIITPGTTVRLSNGAKALVTSVNPVDVLHPMVIDITTNKMIDLSDRELLSDIEVVDTVATLDRRYIMGSQN